MTDTKHTDSVEADLKAMSLEELLFKAQPHIREITFHSDGSVVAKTGGRAPQPKKLYSAKPPVNTIDTYGALARKAVIKLIKENPL